MNQDIVTSIINRFGGVAKIADAVAVSYKTADSWMRRGSIPAKYHQTILTSAASCGIDLSPEDFFAAWPKPRRGRK